MFRPHVNVVFDFISVPYTISAFQAPEPLYYISRGAKWNDVKNVFSAPHKCEKIKSAES